MLLKAWLRVRLGSKRAPSPPVEAMIRLIVAFDLMFVNERH
jgi:hypothetical protein